MTDTLAHLEWPFFDDTHRRLATTLRDWAQSQDALFKPTGQDGVEQATREAAAALGQAGWLRYLVPQQYGGHGDAIDVRSLCLVREGLAGYSGIADCAFAIQGLGSVPITLWGSEALRARYLTAMVAGSHLGAFALSEPETGSDVAGLRTTVRQDGSGFTLNGTKTWISNAGIAHHYVVFARDEAAGLSAFVVDADTRGLEVTERQEITAPHAIGTVSFSDCRIGADRLLGKSGDGFKIAMGTLDVFRPTVGAAALGFARRAMEEALARVGRREVFGQRLDKFQATQMRLADMAVELDAAALLVYRAAWAKDSLPRRVSRESAMAKMYATEAAQRIIDSAVQLFGGLGVTVGSTVERLYREIRPLRIYEGTTEIQKLIIASSLLPRE